MLFKKQKSEPKTDKKREIDFILPLYLNQRIVYDILAIKNDGFTEFYEIMDKKEENNEFGSKVNANFGTNNEFSLIKAGVYGELEANITNDKDNEKKYKRTHTPTSLFMQVYQYLCDNQKIIKLDNKEKLKKISSGDFVEIKSYIEINTIVEFFETFSKVIDITEAFSSFAYIGNEKLLKNNSSLSQLKRPVNNVIKVLETENDKVKYGICKLGDIDIVLKLNKDYFINSDYSEIRNGEFRIIGKIMEIVPEGEKVLLNRENAVGLYDPRMFEQVRDSLRNIPNINIKEFKDEVEGETCIIMPIAIGI